MKNFLIGLFLVTTVAFAGLYLQQNEKTRKASTDVISLKSHITDLEGQLSLQEKRTTALRDRLQDPRVTTPRSTISANPVAEAQEVVTTEAETGTGTNQMKAAFADMFKNPEMRDMIKKQQGAVMGMMIDKNFATLFTSLNMTPEQTATMKELLTKKALVDTGMGVDLMAGNLDADQRKALTDQAKADKEAIDAQIKDYLGADNFTQYQAYEKTIPERMAMGQFKDSLASGASALSGSQEEQLMKMMGEERTAFKFTTDYNDQSKFDGDFASAFSEEKIDKFFSEQEQLSQKYMDRARTILSAEQITAYEKFLVNQREMMKAGMKMAAAMFAPKSGK